MVARELVKPRLSPATRDTLTRAREELTRRRRRCQMNDVIGDHSRRRRLLARLRRGIGVRSGLRNVFSPPGGGQRLGAPSRFHPGEWVRVVDEAQVRATLGPGDRLRGLLFVPAQFTTCGHVYRVHKRVRRIMDDDGRMRPVSGTVLLEGVTCDCGGATLGCGRHCPLFYRDEWLEKAAAPPGADVQTDGSLWVTVKSAAEIRATLDDRGQRDGVSFPREMRRFCGERRRVVRRVERVHELGHWTPTRGPVYILEGAHCAGTALGDCGPCDRACALRWHGDWLAF
jgi:hypothetical protein